jgi:hypothetical protein
MMSRDTPAMADDRLELRLAQEAGAIRQEIAALRADVATRTELQTVRQDMAGGFARLERQVAESRVEVIKWSFLFWTGQCLTIIGFLIVFFRNR